ncbi:hypothetical protein HBA43_20860 [Providencia rettgeri]|nr:hypothetical protein [Providencia rettgeri]NIA80834.1 hypothetical protein [Providencia rettgeri]NIB04078.1 hypothetical protein [Providencia rettgeri]NIB08288.1 hypothetical protein [Providencia rettgeri]NIB21881.1 hypothetical protein [Providencia rettgeri]
MGAVAITLLLAGGLTALQTMTIATALPFAIILLIAIVGLLKALRIDIYKKDSQQLATLAPNTGRGGLSWEHRLRKIAFFPKRNQVKRFMAEVIEPAMQSVVTELEKQGTEVAIHNEKDDRVTLEVEFGENLNFLYEIRLRDYLTPSFALVGMDDDENNESQKYYRAEVYLKEGGQDYDIMGWSEAQIIHDILDQYEKHIHFIHIVEKS